MPIRSQFEDDSAFEKALRDWFAGQMLPRIGSGWPNDENKMILASRCYEIADAMIAARKAGG